MSNSIPNPYHEQEVETHKVQANVSREDWHTVFLPHPYRGNMDGIISTLFSAFAEAVKQENIPTHYEPGNIDRLEAVLRRVTFSSTDREGPRNNE